MLVDLRGGALALVTALIAIGCDEDDGGTSDSADDGPAPTTTMTMEPGEGSGGGDGPPMWVVGEEGEMLRVGLDGAVDRYPIDVVHDFYGIACRGDAEAWVVGAAGTLLATRDAGASWDAIALPTTADLTAIAAAEAGPIWAVGHGVAYVSSVQGDAFEPVAVPARAFTGVAVAPHGAYALLTDAGGQIWRMPAGEPATAVWTGDASLSGISVGGHGEIAVAVGELGTVLRSDDAGETFAPIAIPTAVRLEAVQVAEAGALVIAVGRGGTVVRVHEEQGTTVDALLDPALHLRAVHLAGGHGHVLGDAGVMLETFDAGETWASVTLPTDATLHGLDHPGRAHD